MQFTVYQDLSMNAIKMLLFGSDYIRQHNITTRPIFIPSIPTNVKGNHCDDI